MGSEQDVKNDISGPLEHLLTLNFDRSCILESLSEDVKSDINNSEEVKIVKKVRFADKLIASDDECSELENRKTFDKSLHKDMKGILKVKCSNPVYETEVSLDDYTDENNDEDFLTPETDFDEVNHESNGLFNNDIICEADTLKEEIVTQSNCSSSDDIQVCANSETELPRNDTAELNNIELPTAKLKEEFVDADDVITESREESEDFNVNDTSSPHEIVISSEMCKNKTGEEEVPDKTEESSVTNDSKTKNTVYTRQFTTEKNNIKDSKGIFQKKIERHFKTCFGASTKLNSGANDNKGPTEDKNLLKEDEILASDQRLPKSKQATKMNTILSKDSVTTASATKLKSVVFSAWHQAKDVKTTNIKIEDNRDQSSNKINNLGNKSSDAYKSWKQSKEISIRKKKEKEALRLLNEQSKQQEKQTVKEENEMAFRSWKKQKDELLMKKKIALSKEEQQKQLNSSIEQEMKRKDAEMAFLAWKTQKSQANQIKKKNHSKVLEEQKEKEEIKAMRDKEAQEIYHLWLQTKVSTKNFPIWYEINDRPPWTPPGKNALDSCQCV